MKNKDVSLRATEGSEAIPLLPGSPRRRSAPPRDDSLKGFTLVEVIIYITILAFVVLPSLSIAWIFIQDQTKAAHLGEVQYIGAFVMDQITSRAKYAGSLGAGTVYDTHPGKLVLNFTSSADVVVDTYEKVLIRNGISATLTKLRIQDRSNSYDLTSDAVQVTNFVIKNMSGATGATFQINLSLEAFNPQNFRLYETQRTWSTSISLLE